MKNSVQDSNSQLSSKPMPNIFSQKGFDYEILDRPTQITIKQKTSEIKSLIRQTAQEIVEVGEKLAEVKQQLKHGQFISWLKSEFNWSISSATKFMQVREKFKNVNFAHFNFATSALYVLAAPSTPDSARQYALEIASQGENITYSLAKLIVKHHKELVQKDSYSSNQLDSATIKQSNIQLASPVVDFTYEDVKEKLDQSVRVIRIKQEKPKHLEDRVQDFEIIYGGTCVAVEGRPQDLTVLFEKMQNNPQFAEDIFRQARSPNKFYKPSPIRRIGDADKSIFMIEYDKEYLLSWLHSKVCKPLGALGCDKIVELVKEAYILAGGTTEKVKKRNRVNS